jgi:hypothetical protein
MRVISMGDSVLKYGDIIEILLNSN